MNLSIETIPPVLPPPVKTFTLTLTEREAGLLRTKLGLESRTSVREVFKEGGYSEKVADECHEFTYLIFDALDDADVKNVAKR